MQETESPTSTRHAGENARSTGGFFPDKKKIGETPDKGKKKIQSMGTERGKLKDRSEVRRWGGGRRTCVTRCHKKRLLIVTNWFEFTLQGGKKDQGMVKQGKTGIIDRAEHIRRKQKGSAIPRP